MKSVSKLATFCENTKENFQILNNISTFAAEMAGIYLHIPFCKSRCSYCAFYSTTALQWRQRYVDALCREMDLRPSADEIGTIYLGGGTPSQLTQEQLSQLFDHIYTHYKVKADAEVTIECNPDDVTETFATFLRSLPVNRISMGAQTFNDQRLRFIRRRHSATQVAQAVSRLRAAGIGNISIDLIYGFPGETLADWQQDISQALALKPEHLSAYCLSYEEGTPLYEQKAALTNVVDEETEREMYYALVDRLAAAGFEHYEISNFAKAATPGQQCPADSMPSFRSRHNSSYWTGIPYIGLGAAAHSYDLATRRWNVSDLKRYMEGIEQGKPDAEQEVIDETTRYNDTVMLSLRTCEGLCLDTLSTADRQFCLRAAEPFISQQLLAHTDGHLRLTRQGIFVSDMIISELMRV